MALSINRRWQVVLLLTLILLLAAFARIHHLTQQSLWLDESYTHAVVTRLGPMGAAADDMHPPLYYLVLGGWMALAGDSVLAMRALSMLLSMLTVALVYQLARRMTPAGLPAGRTWIAVTAALLFALSDPDIFMAQEIRMYALHKLVLVGGVLAYVAWVQRPTWWRAALWIGLGIANLYTYYLGGLVLAAQGFHALLYLRGRRRIVAVAGLGLVGVAFLPWAFTGLLGQLQSPNPLFVPDPLNAFAWHEYLRLYFGSHWALLMGLMLLGALPFMAEDDRSRLRLDGGAFLLVLWVVLPFAFIGGIGLFRPFFSARWPWLVTPGIVLLVARGLGALRRPARPLLLAVIVLFSVTTVDFYRPKPPWDVVADRVLAYARPGEAALMELNNGDYSVGYYLRHGLPESVPVHSLPEWRAETTDAEYSQRLQAFFPQYPTVWLLLWGDGGNLPALLTEAGFQITFTQTVDHAGNPLQILRYDRDPIGDPLAVYDNGLVLRRVALAPGEGVVDLWWSAEGPLDRDYTVSVFVLDAGGRLVAQSDGYPAEGTQPTSTWTSDSLVYDPHRLDVAGLPGGTYSIGVQTYYWADGAKIPTRDGDPWATVGTFAMP